MINIQDIIQFMKKGWVAMDKNGKWWWFPIAPYPYMTSEEWLFRDNIGYKEAIPISTMFDIAPADDWIDSLIRIEGNETINSN